jgi:hypothetical protein
MLQKRREGLGSEEWMQNKGWVKDAEGGESLPIVQQWKCEFQKGIERDKVWDKV